MRGAPWRWLVCAAVCAPQAAVAAASATVHLDAGALTASVAAALVAERPSLVLTATPTEAELRVRVVREAGGLRLSVEDAAGAHLVERLIEGEAPAALRLVVLLVSEASDARAAAPPPSPSPSPSPSPTPSPSPSPTPPPPPRPAPARTGQLRAGAHASMASWIGPPSLQLGGGVGVALEIAALRLDLRGTARFCCGVESSVVRATPLGVEGSAEAALRLLRVGPVALSPTAGVTVAWRHVYGIALAYAGPAPEESQAAVELSLTAGALAAWAFSEGWQLEARAAVEVRATRLRVSLPPPYAGGENAIDPGIVSGRLDLAITVPIL